jgi:hypothetical protein
LARIHPPTPNPLEMPPLSWLTLQFLWTPASASCKVEKGSSRLKLVLKARAARCSPPGTLPNLLSVFPYLRLHEYYLPLMYIHLRVNYGEGHAQSEISATASGCQSNLLITLTPPTEPPRFLPPAWRKPHKSQVRSHRTVLSGCAGPDDHLSPAGVTFTFNPPLPHTPFFLRSIPIPDKSLTPPPDCR